MTDPLAAKLAAALFDANIPCDYGEDVDRLIAAMAAAGVTLAPTPPDALRTARLRAALAEIAVLCAQAEDAATAREVHRIARAALKELTE